MEWSCLSNPTVTETKTYLLDYSFGFPYIVPNNYSLMVGAASQSHICARYIGETWSTFFAMHTLASFKRQVNAWF